jgi:hypothetical protein
MRTFSPRTWPNGPRFLIRSAQAGREHGNGEAIMGAFFRVLSAGPMFFVSAWLLMLFAGIVASDVGIRPFGYITSMIVTIGLWLTLAPAIGAASRPGPSKKKANSH